MIIQLRWKQQFQSDGVNSKKAKFFSTNNNRINSQWLRKSDNNKIATIKIPFSNKSMQCYKTRSNSKKKTNHINKNFINKNQCELYEGDVRILNFKPVLQKKKVCENMRYFLQVVQKKIRAKTIQTSFQRSNRDLSLQMNSSKGFKGGKLPQHSIFQNSSYNKPFYSGNFKPNLTQKWQRYAQDEFRNSTQKDSKHVGMIEQIQDDSNKVLNRQTMNNELINALRNSKIQNKIKRPNILLNNYRSKFKQGKQKRILKEIQKDNSVLKQNMNSGKQFIISQIF